MKALRESLKAFLKVIHPNVIVDDKSVSRVWFQRAPSTTPPSYLVFDFQLYPDGEGFELCTLAIDGWSNIPDTSALETLMASVKTLDKKTITNNEQTITFYLENMLPLMDDDESISRRQYNFSGRLFRKG